MTQTRILRRASPTIAETPLEALDGLLTPTPLFYVRDHFDEVPGFDLESWRLAVGGLVERPLSLSLDDLGALPRRELVCTLECAGNGGYGNHLRRGGVSTAHWRGVSLAEVLALAGLRSGVSDVVTRGAESGDDPEAPEAQGYERSLPLARATAPDTLLALEMNGAPLAPEHGAPVRLVVPGWYGMDAVKWLIELRATSAPSGAFYMARRYRADYTKGPQVREMTVKSLIARPVAGARLPLGPALVEGVAWGGDGPVTRVDVSTDGGASWAPAELLGEALPATWRLWRHSWTAGQSGEHVLMARAHDALGQAQPFDLRPGDLGRYRANAVERVAVLVERSR